MFTHLVLI